MVLRRGQGLPEEKHRLRLWPRSSVPRCSAAAGTTTTRGVRAAAGRHGDRLARQGGVHRAGRRDLRRRQRTKAQAEFDEPTSKRAAWSTTSDGRSQTNDRRRGDRPQSIERADRPAAAPWASPERRRGRRSTAILDSAASEGLDKGRRRNREKYGDQRANRAGLRHRRASCAKAIRLRGLRQLAELLV